MSLSLIASSTPGEISSSPFKPYIDFDKRQICKVRMEIKADRAEVAFNLQ
jgi:hypothetical protein